MGTIGSSGSQDSFVCSVKSSAVHILKIDLISHENIKNIETQLNNFWDLEKLDISNCDKSKAGTVTDNISLNGQKPYEVTVSFRENHHLERIIHTCEHQLLELHKVTLKLYN